MNIIIDVEKSISHLLTRETGETLSIPEFSIGCEIRPDTRPNWPGSTRHPTDPTRPDPKPERPDPKMKIFPNPEIFGSGRVIFRDPNPKYRLGRFGSGRVEKNWKKMEEKTYFFYFMYFFKNRLISEKYPKMRKNPFNSLKMNTR